MALMTTDTCEYTSIVNLVVYKSFQAAVGCQERIMGNLMHTHSFRTMEILLCKLKLLALTHLNQPEKFSIFAIIDAGI